MGDIFEAIRSKNLERLTFLADRGAELNEFNAGGYTPLGLAVKIGFTEGIHYLLTLAETDAGKGRNNGDTPLMIAARLDRGKSTATLLSFPSVLETINDANPEGDTALLKAVEHGSMNAFHALLKGAGIDVNKGKAGGVIPLALAATKGNADAVESLLLKGADFNVVGGEDALGNPLTVASLARRGRFDAVINRMILNMDAFGKTYNEPSTIEVRPLGSLAEPHLDVYPNTDKGAAFLRNFAAIHAPIRVEAHTIADSLENMGPFVREVIQVRNMCAGVASSFIAVEIGKVDIYVTLRGGEGDRILGFFYINMRRGGDLFLDLICTRNTVKGAGMLLMNFLVGLARPGLVRTISLDSIETAKGFYERLGFKEKERKAANITNGTWPMVYTVGAVAPVMASAEAAGGAGAGAGAGAHGTGSHGGYRRRKTRRVLRKRK